MARTFDPIELEVLWQSLIATVNEQARALQRAAFSPIVREAGDLANAVFYKRGRMVAQAVTGTPGHINSLARAIGAILDEYPISSLKPGDVIVGLDDNNIRRTDQLLRYVDRAGMSYRLDIVRNGSPGWVRVTR